MALQIEKKKAYFLIKLNPMTAEKKKPLINQSCVLQQGFSSPPPARIHVQAVVYIVCSLSSAALIYCKWVSFLAGSQTVSLARQQ